MPGRKSWRLGLAAVLIGVMLVVWFGRERETGGTASGDRPLVTKPHPRVPGGHGEREMRTKNPREEFEAARKRGLTEEEVRVIVEEFHGLAFMRLRQRGGRLDEFQDFRRKAWQWYSDLLAKGFGFSDEQKRIVSKRLQDMGEKDFSTKLEVFANTLPNDPSKNSRISPEDTEAIEIFLGTGVWLKWQKYEAWELCDLTKNQMEVGWGFDASVGSYWVVGNDRTKDPETDIHYSDLDNPFDSAYLVLSEAGKVFPLSMGQVDQIRAIGDTSSLEKVKFLTEPQLKTLLLFQPEIADKLRREMGE